MYNGTKKVGIPYMIDNIIFGGCTDNNRAVIHPNTQMGFGHF